jgi:hypothetical protein
MKSHSSSGLEISKFEKSCAHMSIIVEKSEEFILELREFLLTRESSVIFHIVIKKMNRFWFEKLS